MPREKHKTVKQNYSLVVYDPERARVHRIKNERLFMAIKALVKGSSPSQFCTNLAMHAREKGDDHPLWNIHRNTARKLLDDARKELQKDLAKDRARAYATQMARYEHLYRIALKLRDGGRQALAVLQCITDLQERISGSGSSEQQEGRKAGKAGEEIGKAVEQLTRALARNRASSRKPADEAGQEPPGTEVS